jgi:hypothetical protein
VLGILLSFEDWLGGLDSNQDSQIQSLESYQLDDLPAEGRNADSPGGKNDFRNCCPTFLE